MKVTSPIDDLVTDLAKAYALSEFYPLAHPTLVKALHRLENALLMLRVELRLDVGPGGFATGVDPVARRSPHAARFAAALAEHGVTALGIRPDVGAAVLGRLLSGATLPPRVARAAGGLAHALGMAGVTGVTVNGQQVQALAPAPAPQAPSPPPAFAKPQDGITLWSAQDVYEQVRESAHRAEQENVDELRRMLREGADSQRIEVLHRLEFVAQWAVEQGLVDRSVALVEDLRRDAEHLAGKSPAVRGHVMLAIHRLASHVVIEELVKRLGRARSEDERAGLRSSILHIGADCVSPLVRELTAASDLTARRNYRDALVALDHVGVPLLSDMVGDERWFVVRNMVGILGEIRSPDALEHFAVTIRHHDARVRRETILALSKIGGEEAVPLLVRGLGDAEAGLRAAAALGLGLTKSGAAVGPLMQRLQAEADPEVMVEIVRALGRTGDPRAIPALADRAGGGGWLSRTPVPLRVEAVRALGEIGGEPARAVLQRLMRDRASEVREAAVKAAG
jgi:HEAT repeat protein